MEFIRTHNTARGMDIYVSTRKEYKSHYISGKLGQKPRVRSKEKYRPGSNKLKWYKEKKEQRDKEKSRSGSRTREYNKPLCPEKKKDKREGSKEE